MKIRFNEKTILFSQDSEIYQNSILIIIKFLRKIINKMKREILIKFQRPNIKAILNFQRLMKEIFYH